MGSPDARRRFGRRVIVVVLAGAVVPLLVVGLWATRSAVRSGRALLRSQLEAQLAETVRDTRRRWADLRSGLLTIGESEPARLTLLDTSGVAVSPPAWARRVFDEMGGFTRIVVLDRDGEARWSLDASPIAVNGAPRGHDERGFTVQVPVTDLTTGDTLGAIAATIRVETLVPAATRPATVDGPVTAVLAAGREPVLPFTADVRLLSDERFTWGGHRWLTVRQSLPEVGFEIAMASPLDPYVVPFGRAATRSAAAVLLVSGLIAILVVTWTRRLTREVERELAQREALAAVGEFASELAHEVRNPLTAMRLDLQRAEESAGDAGTVRTVIPRVLQQMDRMDRAVTGALRVARGGSVEPRPVDLREILRAARQAAEPELARRGGKVVTDIPDDASLDLQGDAPALEQLFLNLLLNAAQALAVNGEVCVAAARRNGDVEVTIRDNGVGMGADALRRAQQPFGSSRRDGTGLGLKIARRIVASHGGTLDIRSTPGEGTAVRVLLPVR